MRHGIEHFSDGDYVCYWTPCFHWDVPPDSPSASEWMIPGTWIEEFE